MSKRNVLRYLLWALCATLWVTLCFILPDFSDSPIKGLPSILTIIVYLSALGIASFGIIYLLGLYRYVTWIGLPILGIGGAVVSYYRVAFHATITPMIIDATLHTNSGTIAGVVSWPLFVWLIVNIGISIGFIVWRNRLKEQPKAWFQALLATGLLLLYYNANDRLQTSINQRYPYNVIHNLSEYYQQQQQLSEVRQQLAYHAINIPDSIDIVFLLGEAVRADHLQLNGYDRETTPLLSVRNHVVSLPNIYSEHTYTSTSVPVILSPADSIHPERSGNYSSFLYTMNECGFRSVWLSNQDNGRTYVSFIQEADTVIFPNASKSVFVFDPWYDEQLFPSLDSLMNHSSARNIYVLHTIGSHWYYNLHVPEHQWFFHPTTTDRIITNNTVEQICNSYDNTIRYMDYIADNIIQRMEDRCSILIYLSDHGEALGENGNYLHASESEALHRPACFIWYSDSYAATFPDKIRALIANKDKRYRTDFLYYSILSATGIEAYEETDLLNIFRQ